MLEHFTPEAARGLPGPDWLATRRGAAIERLADLEWPTAAEEIWRYSRIGELDLDRVPPGTGGADRRAGRRARARRRSDRGRGRRAIGPGRRAQRPRRAPRARRRRSRPRACGCAASPPATPTSRHAARYLLRRVARRVHGAARRVPRRWRLREGARAASWSTSRSSCCTGRRATASRRSRTRWWSPRTAPRSRCSTASAPPTPAAAGTGHLVDAVVELIVGDNAHVRYLSVQEHGPHTWQVALQRAHLGRDASLRRRPSRSAATTRACAASRCSTGSGAESDLTRGLLRRRPPDARLPHAAGPRRAQHAQRPAVQGCGRGHRAVGVLGPDPHPPRGPEVGWRSRPTATSCSPRAPTPSRSPTSRSRPTT